MRRRRGDRRRRWHRRPRHDRCRGRFGVQRPAGARGRRHLAVRAGNTHRGARHGDRRDDLQRSRRRRRFAAAPTLRQARSWSPGPSCASRTSASTLHRSEAAATAARPRSTSATRTASTNGATRASTRWSPARWSPASRTHGRRAPGSGTSADSTPRRCGARATRWCCRSPPDSIIAPEPAGLDAACNTYLYDPQGIGIGELAYDLAHCGHSPAVGMTTTAGAVVALVVFLRSEDPGEVTPRPGRAVTVPRLDRAAP